jgi:hypothetical protein
VVTWRDMMQDERDASCPTFSGICALNPLNLC